MNFVALTGRLTADPVISFTTGEKCVSRFTLAVSKFGKDAGADFIACVAFGKTAELMEKYCAKGQQIAVTGRINTGSYEKDGHKVFTTNVACDRIEFLSKAEKKSEDGDIPSGFTPFNHEDDILF